MGPKGWIQTASAVLPPERLEGEVVLEVTFVATTPDVIHGIHVARTRVNMMLIPGQISRNTYTFDEPGLYVFLRGSNLLDEDIRQHTSPLKDLVPLPGRSLHFGLRYEF